MTDRESGFLGFLVSFLASRDRKNILASWSEDSEIAFQLERLGQVAWSDVRLLRSLRPFGDEHLALNQLRGSADSHYLVAMAATRRAVSRDHETAAFVERLRVLVLIRALEAGAAGVPREANLNRVCTELRQVCDQTHHPKWAWISRIAHPYDGIGDFVSETRHKCQLALATKKYEDAGESAFFRALVAVLERTLKSLGDAAPIENKSRHQPQTTFGSDLAWAGQLFLAPETRLATIHIANGIDEGQTFAIVKVDATRPAPAQRDQATGLILQSLEDTQYLRHSWHHLSSAEETAFLSRLTELLHSTSPINQLGAALVALALLTSTPISSLGHFPMNAPPDVDWALDLRQGALHRRPPRFGKRWRADSRSSKAWVRSMADEWRIDLPDDLLEPLRARKGRARIGTLGELWEASNAQATLESWFSSHFANVEALERLTSPAVALALGQQVFNASGDHVLSRLVALDLP